MVANDLNKNEVLHLIALNDPFTGNMHGVRGADFACYHQARAAGFTTTFRAFVSSQVQDLDKIVHHSDRGTPVVNLRGQVLFNSWDDMFRDGGAFFSLNTPIYSFDRKDVFSHHG
ncbi:Collagen alpha-1(XV) chain [Trichinella pseudospiralis]|nr:Collagen alpha-1(XV) chain [Trichinella pseudospiralis]